MISGETHGVSNHQSMKKVAQKNRNIEEERVCIALGLKGVCDLIQLALVPSPF